ncbi:MAG: S8 family serine peptidase [Candidatus Sericytochromatia bacterium]|nr:S8 family serine peptidase [Candidatus Sericytochromatia bacterium]
MTNGRSTAWNSLQRHVVPLAAMLTLLGCGSPPAVNTSAMMPADAGVRMQSVPGRYVVQFKDTAAGDHFKARTKAKLYKNLAELGVEVLELPVGTDLQTVQSAEEVDFAEPDFLYTFQPTAETLASKEKNTPGLSGQYALKMVDAPTAWRKTRGDAGVTIAIIDTGIDRNHPDLRGRITGGYNVLEPKSPPTDENGHGTHVAGIAAASSNVLSGMAPNCKIMPIKVANAHGMASTSQIAEGIAYAALHGADVINLSIGGPAPSKTLEKAVAACVKRNIPLVAAMGNDGSNKPMYPAAYAGVIAVGATNQRDEVTNYSQKGRWISVVAPGDGIISTTPTYTTNLIQTGATTAKYGRLSGTSMAAPLVSGIVAMMRSTTPGMSPKAIKQRLEETTDGNHKYSTTSGYGRVNAARAVGAIN